MRCMFSSVNHALNPELYWPKISFGNRQWFNHIDRPTFHLTGFNSHCKVCSVTDIPESIRTPNHELANNHVNPLVPKQNLKSLDFINRKRLVLVSNHKWAEMSIAKTESFESSRFLLRLAFSIFKKEREYVCVLAFSDKIRNMTERPRRAHMEFLLWEFNKSCTPLGPNY